MKNSDYIQTYNQMSFDLMLPDWNVIKILSMLVKQESATNLFFGRCVCERERERKKWISSNIPLSLDDFCILLYFLIPSLKIDSVIFEPLLVGSITSLLISLTLCKKHPLLINKNNIFSRLGKYTYAMYLFHTILINLIVKFSSNFSLFFLLSLITTIISSILSYYLFENQFLKLKKFFY